MKISILPIKDVTGKKTRVKTSFQLDSITMGERTFFFPDPLQVEVEIHNLEDSYLVQGKISLQLGLSCSRCLQEITEPLSLDFIEEFSQEGEEVIGDTLDITAGIVENILLEIPQKPLCSEDCKGLCPRCGQDQNRGTCHCQRESIDPRLAGLADYFKGR